MKQKAKLKQVIAGMAYRLASYVNEKLMGN